MATPLEFVGTKGVCRSTSTEHSESVVTRTNTTSRHRNTSIDTTGLAGIAGRGALEIAVGNAARVAAGQTIIAGETFSVLATGFALPSGLSSASAAT